MDLAGLAAAARALADRAETELAAVACEEGARDFLAVLRLVTPKRTGHLMDSETITGPTGGAVAVALVGPHCIYAQFRNDGGTITRKKPRPAVLGTPAVGFFGRGNPAQVTQKGAHYMEKAHDAGQSIVREAVERAVEEFFTSTGL